MTFQIEKMNKLDRVYRVNLEKENIFEYLNKVKDISLRDTDHVPFFRFLLAKNFEFIFQIKDTILQSVKDYKSGAILIECNTTDENDLIKISTAISYLLGNPSIDPLSGKYYAIFTIQHTDEKVPGLFSPYEQFRMHTDGAYMKMIPDWIFFMKIQENAAIGGQTKLLHIDDWSHFFDFYNTKLKFNFFEHPAMGIPLPRYSSNEICNISASLLNFKDDKKTIRFVDRFIYPNDLKEAEYVYKFQQSLENSTKAFKLDIPIGSLLLINNHFWLHGRMPFEQNKYLSRSLMRQRGHFR